ncbi:MAG: 16S rRNA (cytosine(1402)-N(4))-methyltransferase RsmH [Deltaproteobacteria bacterium]|nr:16S rRNA (cytosine(1402)-N(4))-methyltransferase RsmH [Deltaproteobacteria bacterium]
MVMEVLAGLNIRPGRLYVDGTVGEGGHAAAILDRLLQAGELIGLDKNPDVLQRAASRLAPYTSRFRLFHRSFSQLGEVLEAIQVQEAAGILLDLGLSLYLLEHSGRGFSFRRDEPLDMRFDPLEPVPTAADLLNTSSPSELETIFRAYGEEPQARLLARRVVEARRRRPFRTTRDLVEVVTTVIRPKGPRSRIHPATRVFQALRIAVNRELEELETFLSRAPDWLAPQGRLVVLSYHSLEDRLVKQRFLEWERGGVAKRLTKKPSRPGPEEVRRNPRARTARLRIAEKI